MPLSTIETSLNSIPFYQTHPYMKPFVGRNYESALHKKLLLVGESHYLPAGSTVQRDVDGWYSGSPTLTEVEEGWCNTRGTREWLSGSYCKTLNSALKSVAPFAGENAFDEVASYNYFLRPAEEQGDSIANVLTAKDREYAIRNFIDVLEATHPDIVIMTSRLVVNCAEVDDYPKYFGGQLWHYTDRMNCKYVYVNHPSSPHWNMAERPDYFKGLTSCRFFVKFLKENWLK
ncbi:hypothetical protein SAMN05720764_103166 [Fibrobacter sp. UWH5]|nr:hypothetical protein SAMN05720764_103166 [Fibrobacter sp. UWH5]